MPTRSDPRVPRRLLSRAANLLDEEADTLARSYGLIDMRTWKEREKCPVFEDNDAKDARRYREYRRLARQLREKARG